MSHLKDIVDSLVLVDSAEKCYSVQLPLSVEMSVSLLQNSNSSMSGAVMKRGSKSKNRIKM